MQSSLPTCMDLAAGWRWTFLSKRFYAARRPVRAPHIQPPARHTLPTDRLTYDFSSTCRYSGTPDDWLERHTADILSREREKNKKKKHHNWENTPEQPLTRCTNLFGHLGNKTLHEEIRKKEADCRNAPQSCSWRTGLTPRERSLVTSIWTYS